MSRELEFAEYLAEEAAFRAWREWLTSSLNQHPDILATASPWEREWLESWPDRLANQWVARDSHFNPPPTPLTRKHVERFFGRIRCFGLVQGIVCMVEALARDKPSDHDYWADQEALEECLPGGFIAAIPFLLKAVNSGVPVQDWWRCTAAPRPRSR
ncbi:MAG TPA: hypothetical protein PK992_07685 [Planctomycetaceae bacterium]|nr:hypothetical protein [Planctomycetaceae bacterium]